MSETRDGRDFSGSRDARSAVVSGSRHRWIDCATVESAVLRRPIGPLSTYWPQLGVGKTQLRRACAC